MSLFYFSNFLNIDRITMAYSLKSTAQAHLVSLGTCPADPAPTGRGLGARVHPVPQHCLLFKRRTQPKLLQQQSDP